MRKIKQKKIKKLKSKIKTNKVAIHPDRKFERYKMKRSKRKYFQNKKRALLTLKLTALSYKLAPALGTNGTDIELFVFLDKTTKKFVNPKKLPKDSPRYDTEVWSLKEQADGSLQIRNESGVIITLDELPKYFPNDN